MEFLPSESNSVCPHMRFLVTPAPSILQPKENRREGNKGWENSRAVIGEGKVQEIAPCPVRKLADWRCWAVRSQCESQSPTVFFGGFGLARHKPQGDQASFRARATLNLPPAPP
jgi:hypothetical protein